MQKIRRVHPAVLATSFALLIMMLFCIVFAAQHHGDKVEFGFIPGAHAFGASRMLQSASPHYACIRYDSEEIILRALDNKVIDAALLSVETALSLPQDTYAMHGVFSVTDLCVVASEETILNISSLSGRTLILPAALEGSKEESMLKKLLEEESAAGCTLVYARNPLSAHHENPGSALLLPLDMLPSILQQDGALSVRFRLSQQWRTSFLAAAPAGHCIVYRREIAGTSTYLSFENALRDSMLYSDRKRKKTIAMAVASGLFADEETAGLVIDHMSFSYLEGADMEEAVDAWKRL